jgi:hypothetical protein
MTFQCTETKPFNSEGSGLRSESEVPSKYMKEAQKCEVDGVVSVCSCNDISPECRHTGYAVICE